MKKSLLLAFAVFAMIFASCSKDKDSASNSGGGGGGVTPTPPVVGEYGMISIDDQSFEIGLGAYYVENDTLSIVLADGLEVNDMYGIAFPNCNTIPEGTFEYSIQEVLPGDACMGVIVIDEVFYYCMAGRVTITKTNTNYKIESTGLANTIEGIAQGSYAKEFSVDFEGPIIIENK